MKNVDRYAEKFDKKNLTEHVDRAEITAILADFSISDVETIEVLNGGFNNVNLKVDTIPKKSFALRISTDESRVETEIALLNRLNRHVPVPKIYGHIINHKNSGRHVLLSEFLPGTTLSVIENSLSADEIHEIARLLGAVLADIHRFTFSKSGFLGKDCKVIEPFPSFFHGYYGYMLKFLKSKNLANRLPRTTYDSLKKFILDNRKSIEDIQNQASLVHGDFNQKNILVHKYGGKWQVSGILDWEYAFSGSPLVDFGNFFRFEDEVPAYQEHLVTAYLEQGGILESNWEYKAKVLDLLPMMEFLTREGNYPKTFSTAKKVIERTLLTFL